MQRVFVLDKTKQPLSPCHPARARDLLRKRRAAVYRRYPFTIILKDRDGGAVQPLELKLDPGSKTTGVALVADFASSKVVVWAAEIHHRGHQIRLNLESRRTLRRSRRHRKTRYRQPRFDNRTRPQGWLPPSLRSRVDNCDHWTRRIQRFAPVAGIAVETVRFDMQLMQNPEISGVEYQQGTLQGYEVREYLLEKFGRQCFYCGTSNVPLEVEHAIAKSRGGSNRVSNLTLACRRCNDEKDNRDVREFLADKPNLLKKLLAQLKAPLKDAAAVNATRYAIGNKLKAFGLPTSFWSGGRTKHNRIRQGYSKDHWVDAACVGETGAEVVIPQGIRPLEIHATGHGSRQMCRVDRFGFPRTSAKAAKSVRGFKTGDIARAVVVNGKKQGTHIGRVAVRSTGSFNIKTESGTVQGLNWRHFVHLHRADGYTYSFASFLPVSKDRGFLEAA